MYSYVNGFGVTSLSLQVGCDDTERRIVWLQTAKRNGARVRYAKLSDYERAHGFTNENSTIVDAKTETVPVNAQFISCKARLTDLELGEKYIYTIGDGDEFDTDAYCFSMPKAPKQKLSFGVISDVHFNVYRRADDDVSYRDKLESWEKTLGTLNSYSDEPTAFIMSIGDNCSVYQMPQRWFLKPEFYTPEGIASYAERENEEFFAVPLMKSIAFASVVGNHDATRCKSPSPYAGVSAFHFDMPNDDGRTGHFFDNSHGNFYFLSGDVLIIGMNVIAGTSGNYCGTVEEHRAFVERAISAYPCAKWRIIFNHVHSYSYVGSEDFTKAHTPSEGAVVREAFDRILHGLDIDAVFLGHQHCFSRSYHILDSEVVDRGKTVNTTDENGYLVSSVKNPRGTLHYTVPAPTAFSFFSEVREDCHDWYANYGICEHQFTEAMANGYMATKDYRGFTYNQPMATHVTVESLEGITRMTVKCIGCTDAIARDTYIIEKTN